jgi:hypothetical protein
MVMHSTSNQTGAETESPAGGRNKKGGKKGKKGKGTLLFATGGQRKY